MAVFPAVVSAMALGADMAEFLGPTPPIVLVAASAGAHPVSPALAWRAFAAFLLEGLIAVTAVAEPRPASRRATIRRLFDVARAALSIAGRQTPGAAHAPPVLAV
jgi:hypothetical protein